MTLKEIRYSLLAEGIAEYYAIELILNKIGQKYNCKFIQSSLKLSKSANPSKSKVYANIYAFASKSYTSQEALFIVGVDLDSADFEDNQWQKEANSIQQRLPKKTNHVIIFIPIQAFDYWLLYQKYQIEKTKKPVNHSLEAKNKNEIKAELYGDKNPNRAKIESTCQKILLKIDVEELCAQSISFKRFYDELEFFLGNTKS
jgi:hypothetical protein